jgi:2-oxoglutarate ferredoxin oxidoreductase subunit gamma
MDPKGTLLVEQDLVRVSGVPAGVRVHSIPATRMAEELGKKIVMNVIVVGFFAAKSGVLSKEDYRRAIADSVPKSALDLNLRAFETGYEYGLRPDGHEESLEALAASGAVEE